MTQIDLQLVTAIAAVSGAWILAPFTLGGTIFLCGLGIGLGATMISETK